MARRGHKARDKWSPTVVPHMRDQFLAETRASLNNLADAVREGRAPEGTVELVQRTSEIPASLDGVPLSWIGGINPAVDLYDDGTKRLIKDLMPAKTGMVLFEHPAAGVLLPGAPFTDPVPVMGYCWHTHDDEKSPHHIIHAAALIQTEFLKARIPDYPIERPTLGAVMHLGFDPRVEAEVTAEGVVMTTTDENAEEGLRPHGDSMAQLLGVWARMKSSNVTQTVTVPLTSTQRKAAEKAGVEIAEPEVTVYQVR